MSTHGPIASGARAIALSSCNAALRRGQTARAVVPPLAPEEQTQLHGMPATIQVRHVARGRELRRTVQPAPEFAPANCSGSNRPPRTLSTQRAAGRLLSHASKSSRRMTVRRPILRAIRFPLRISSKRSVRPTLAASAASSTEKASLSAVANSHPHGRVIGP